MRFFLLMGIFSFIFGSCARKPSAIPPSEITPEITSEMEEGGFVDLCFAIREYRKQPDGSQSISAYGVHNGKEVGLEILLGPNWKQGPLLGSVVTYKGTVTYRSLGPQSNAFLRVLDELYETKLAPQAMRTETQFTGITLGGNPSNPDEKLSIKLFFESDDEKRYAELYTNVDLKAKKLEIHEKDPDYRKPIIVDMSAP
jgi:hypothetical protein